MQLTIEVRRAGVVEATHPCSAVMVERGQAVFAVGMDISSYWRSACKPFQLVTSLAHLDADWVDALDPCDLAIGAASHSGQPSHVLRVRALLAQLGLREEQLQCGAHAPMHEPSARCIIMYQNAMSNCSGKHTFMLAACVREKWPLDYRSPEHPLQRANRLILDTMANVSHGVGVDGCSIPTFHAPLSGQALAWSRLASAMGAGEPSAGSSAESRLGRVGWAMHHHPFFMSGTGRLDLAVVRAAGEPLTVKIGAEGLFCIARPNAQQGIAVKVHSGSSEALAPAVRAVLERLGVPLAGELPGEKVFNVRGVHVGERLATWG